MDKEDTELHALQRHSLDLEDADETAHFLRHRHPSPSAIEPAVEQTLEPHTPLRSRFTGSSPYRSYILHGLAIASYTFFTVMFIAITRQSDQIHNRPDNISRHPALPNVVDHLTYSMEMYGFTSKSEYSGRPSDGNNAKWNELLDLAYLNVTGFELRAAANYDLPNAFPHPVRSSLELPGGGQLATLGAWADLECVRRLWEANWRDSAVSGQTLDKQRMSADYCVERLRRVVMCGADIETLIAYSWIEHGEVEYMEEQARGRCVNWQGLEESIRRSGRVVGRDAMNELYKQRPGQSDEP